MASYSIQRKYSHNGRAYLTDSDVIESRIVRSAVTELPFPVNRGDAVSIEYLETFTTNNNYTSIEVSGTDWFELAMMPTFGNRSISINSIKEGGPNACWRVSKSSAASEASITLITFSTAADECVFDLTWLPNTALQLHKTTDQWNGIYEVAIQR